MPTIYVDSTLSGRHYNLSAFLIEFLKLNFQVLLCYDFSVMSHYQLTCQL